MDSPPLYFPLELGKLAQLFVKQTIRLIMIPQEDLELALAIEESLKAERLRKERLRAEVIRAQEEASQATIQRILREEAEQTDAQRKQEEERASQAAIQRMLQEDVVPQAQLRAFALHRAPATPPRPPVNLQILEKLETLVTGRLAELFSKPHNIHLHTVELGQICRTHFLTADNSRPFSNPGELMAEFKKYRDEALAITPPAQLKDVQIILTAIEARGDSAIEPETQLNLMTMFVKAWGLTKHLADPLQYQKDILNVLEHNRTTKGGCDAGICARLILPYTTFFFLEMKTASLPPGHKLNIKLSVFS